jgi:hypothetical protein
LRWGGGEFGFGGFPGLGDGGTSFNPSAFFPIKPVICNPLAKAQLG